MTIEIRLVADSGVAVALDVLSSIRSGACVRVRTDTAFCVYSWSNQATNIESIQPPDRRICDALHVRPNPWNSNFLTAANTSGHFRGAYDVPGTNVQNALHT